MKNIRKLLGNSKKAIISSGLIIGMLLAIGVGTTFAAGNTQKQEKNKDTALSVALFNAGVKEADIYNVEVELEDGKYYEIEFYHEGVEYDYKVDANTNEVISKEVDQSKNALFTREAKRRDLVEWKQVIETLSKDAGVSVDDLRYTEMDLEREDGRLVYEVEFHVDGVSYEYKVDANTGEIVKRDQEVEKRRKVEEKKSSLIGIERAKEIALEHAKQEAGAVKFTKSELDDDDDHYEYELKFYSATKDFEYEIDAISGKVLKSEIDNMDDRDESRSKKDLKVNAQRAKEIALAHAGVTFELSRRFDVDLDEDDDVLSWEIEFYANGMKYEYDIDAKTGGVIGVEKEEVNNRRDDRDDEDDDRTRVTTQATTQVPTPTTTTAPIPTTVATQAPTTTTTQTQYINAQRAKEIATAHAGFKVSQVRFDDVEFDKDDGVASWEVEFKINGGEYEYDINARTGAIITYEHDVPRPVQTTQKQTTTQAPAPTTTTVPKPTTVATQAPAPTTKKTQVLSLQQAKEIAARHAGINLANASFDEAELDEDDGRLVWELEFEIGDWEYDYEIDARTGKILEYDIENDD